MLVSILSTAALGTILAQAAAVASFVAVIGLVAAGLLAWQLWRARQSYTEDLTEQSQQVLEAEEKARLALEEKEALAKDSQVKSEMMATLSREIRAHLNGVIGSADLLLDTAPKPQQRDLLVTLRSSAEALHQSLNDVVEYSSIEAGRIHLARLPFELRQPLIAVVETLTPQALLKGLELVLIIAPDVPTQVTGDAGRLRQLLLNLMSNSVRFTSTGRVVLRVEMAVGSASPSKHGGSWLHFSVSDTGPGISEEAAATIFDRFEQSDSPSPRKFGGSGLELAISRKLVELMGGKIGAHALPESGSEFWAVLPLVVTDPKTLPPPPPESGLHVVVLDSLPASRVAASAMLSRLGIDHDVTDTEGKAEGLLRDALAANARQLVLMADESVFKAGAAELARVVAPGSPLHATRVILMSSRPDEVHAPELGLPTAIVLRKPLLRSEPLLEALHRVPGTVPRSRSPFDIAAEFAAREGPLVLVVDDDEISRSVTSQLLARLGCKVEVAVSGFQAIDRAGHNRFELVFMDCQMPEMSGYTATEKIRTALGDAAPPIVALTANTAEWERERCFAVGMCDFIAKPARTTELTRVLKAWTNQARSQAQ